MAAPVPRGLIEMQVVGMGRAMVRREHGSENRARFIARAMKERGVVALAAPVRRNSDAPAIFEHERGHIDGVAGRMFAPVAGTAAIDATATVCTEVLDRA